MLRNRQQYETTQVYLRLDSHYERVRYFKDEMPKHNLESVKLQFKRSARLVEEARWLPGTDEKAEAAAEDAGDDMILQQIDTEKAAEIEHGRTIVQIQK